MSYKAYVVENNSAHYLTWIDKTGLFEKVTNPYDAEIAIFPNMSYRTHPAIYKGKKPETATHWDDFPLVSNAKLLAFYKFFKLMGVPCIGINQGGIFISAMSGANIITSTTQHKLKHEIVSYADNKTYTFHSMHSEIPCPWKAGMKEEEDFEIIAFAEKRSDYYKDGDGSSFILPKEFLVEPEIIYFIKAKNLAIVPSIEWVNDAEGEKYIQNVILKFVNDTV